MADELTLTDDEPVVRTHFGDDAAWQEIVDALTAPVPIIGEAVPLNLIEDREYAGLDAENLLKLLPKGHHTAILLIADERSMREADHPLLAVDPTEGGGASFRMTAAEAWGPISNLQIANMDWEDFADSVDEDGVYRGFPE
jgi:hypothetical protein